MKTKPSKWEKRARAAEEGLKLAVAKAEELKAENDTLQQDQVMSEKEIDRLHKAWKAERAISNRLPDKQNEIDRLHKEIAEQARTNDYLLNKFHVLEHLVTDMSSVMVPLVERMQEALS